MGYFSDVAVRPNAGVFAASWVNALRTAGAALEAAVFGTSALAETQASIANNQSSAANVTGLVHLSSAVRTVFIEYNVKRVATATVMESGLIVAHYDGSAWSVNWQRYVGDAGIEFSITSGGQIQYTTDNMAGSYSTGSSKMTFRSSTFAA